MRSVHTFTIFMKKQLFIFAVLALKTQFEFCEFKIIQSNINQTNTMEIRYSALKYGYSKLN